MIDIKYNRTKSQLLATEGIVTLADSHYYPGIETLYLSVQQSYPVPITCFDVGLTDEQKIHADTHYPLLDIRPLPATPEIDRIKTVFEDAKPLAKVGKRVWPLWVCPFLIAASPYQRVFWLDGDLVVLRRLPELFAMLEDGPVFTLENNAPEHTPNQAALYELLPTGREADPAFDRTQPPVNGGVSGWDLVRDREVLQAYMAPILRACDDPAVRAAIAWHDQGALIWAVQRHALEHRVLHDTRWNLCVRHNRTVTGKRYAWGPTVLDELRTDEPNACLLHWNGRKVPWLA